MTVKTTGLWAPIIKSSRTEWINWCCVRSTRREAKAAYLEDMPKDMHKQLLNRVRFAKVFIQERE